MTHVELFIQRDVAHETVRRLGETGVIEFNDLNPNVNAFNRLFVNDVKRCDELERKLRFFSDQVDKAKESGILKEEDVKEASTMDLDQLELYFEDLESSLKQLNQNDVLLSREYYHYIEMKEVLEKNKQFIADQERGLMTGATEISLSATSSLGATPSSPGGAAAAASQAPADADFIETGGSSTASGAVGYISGVILEEKLDSFERVLFRSTRGNMLLRHASIEKPIIDPQTDAPVQKVVFIVFFHGTTVRARVQKICEAMGANIYPCPRQKNLWEAKAAEVNSKLAELKTVVTHTNENKRQALRSAAGQIKSWRELLIKEKATYHTMNMFKQDQVRRCLMAEGWCPTDSMESVQAVLHEASEARGEQVPSILREKSTRAEPPTYFRTNKFTSSFQAIVDAYGMAKYQEVNPAPFSMSTFPFLFAVMFGDVGHGLLLTLYACFLLWKEKSWGKGKHLPEMIRMTYQGRYLLIIMGVLSIYTGFLYNELFSVPMRIFPSMFKWREDDAELLAEPHGKPYPFGADWIWHGLPNELAFSNSMKMKLSVILGVSQMILGVVLSLFNHLHFHDTRSIYCEFVPQMFYLCGIFGYLVVTMFIKWSIDWNCQGGICRQPPSLTNLLIAMFLQPGSVAPEDKLYAGQSGIQTILLFLAVISIPWMLLLKPYLLKKEHQRNHNPASAHLLMRPAVEGESRPLTAPTPEGSELGANDSAAHSVVGGHGGGGHGEHGEEFDFSEIFVHQVIHTIEFVLGGVSHTASYLRLWALSLAHAQLSAVFWDKIMGLTINSGSPIMAFVGFGVWGGATIGVLMCMESLSAFLHALRLHWVEFQSKFYKSDGRKFAPLDFKVLIEEAETGESAD